MVISTIALQLGSENTVSTGTSVQTTFGYNGDLSMRHALRTYHGSNAYDNRMDFLVWMPDVGSTATMATRNVLSLLASTMSSNGSMHVIPFGSPDVELEVSNGLTTGGGTMQRLQVLFSSSRRFKSDIHYLDEKDEDKALAETSALSHVKFRYKPKAVNGDLVDDPRQQQMTGLIYEEVPNSLKGRNGDILANERLANVELALKAAMRKIEIVSAIKLPNFLAPKSYSLFNFGCNLTNYS